MNGFPPRQKFLALVVVIFLLSLPLGSVRNDLAFFSFEEAISQVYLSVDNDRDAENVPLKTGPDFPVNADMDLTSVVCRHDGKPSLLLKPPAAVPHLQEITFDIFIPPRNRS